MTQGQLVQSNVGEGRKWLKVSVAHFDNSDLVRSHSKTLIGRCMHPEKQKISSLLMMLPKIWMVEGRVTGADLGMGKFQFHFYNKEDIEAVMELQPYHFDYWMIALPRWQLRMSRSFPSEIPFWIKVDGLPSEFWSASTLQSIGDAIGVTTDVDLDFGKMGVILDGLKELTFDSTIEFKGGEFYEEEEVSVLLKYEKLFGYCKICFSLCHNDDHYLLNPNPVKKTENKEEVSNRRDDRARSYKGVVLNGEVEQKEKDVRGYNGKGKGKLYEENESKWVWVPERKNHRYPYHGSSRTEDGSSRNRHYRGEPHRSHSQEERDRMSRGSRRERSLFNQAREESKEEGEIQRSDKVVRQFPVEKKTEEKQTEETNNLHQMKHDEEAGNTNLREVISTSMGMENGLEQVVQVETGTGKSYLDPSKDKNGEDSLDNMVMDVEETEIVDGEMGGLGSGDEFQELTDGEMEEVETVQGFDEENMAVAQATGTEEKGLSAGGDEKKKASRKPTLKTVMAAGTSKRRFVQAMLSPRKHAQAKQGKRHGDGLRQAEYKGPLNPKLHTSKSSNVSHG